MSSKKEKKSKKEESKRSSRRNKSIEPEPEPEPLSEELKITSKDTFHAKEHEVISEISDDPNTESTMNTSSSHIPFDEKNQQYQEDEIVVDEEVILSGDVHMEHKQGSFVSILEHLSEGKTYEDYKNETTSLDDTRKFNNITDDEEDVSYMEESNKLNTTLYDSEEEEYKRTSIRQSINDDKLFYEEELPSYSEEKPLGVYLCNEHGILGLLRPSTVVVAHNETEAYELLELELSRCGYPCMREKKYRLFHIDLRSECAIMICAEELKDEEIRSLENKPLRLWACVNHHVLPPLSAASIIVTNSMAEAINLLDEKLIGRGLCDSNNMPYTLMELSTKKPAAYILSHGVVETATKEKKRKADFYE